MKFRLLLCLALVFSGGLFGCSTTKPASIATDAEQIKLPITFASLDDFFTFVARNSINGMPINDDTVSKLVADSTDKIVDLDSKQRQMPFVHVLESHYFNRGFDEIRGVKGNGQFYILRPLTNKVELVGILDGNSYRLQPINGTPRFVSYWHLSANKSSENIYEWNGKFFEQKK
jgi:hypothetical protein